MNNKPSKKQQDFQDWARCEYGCVVSGMNCDAIHHIKGARMKLKGVKGAGEWFILPLSYWWHQDGDNKRAVHVNRKEFAFYTKKNEKEWWIELIKDYQEEFGEKPMTEEEYQIILDRA
jgi:hypothetical protein